MNDINITDPALATTLNGSDVPLAIRNQDGALLGYFTPVLNTKYPHVEDELPPEELRRRIEDRTSPRLSTPEVLSMLRGSN